MAVRIVSLFTFHFRWRNSLVEMAWRVLSFVVFLFGLVVLFVFVCLSVCVGVFGLVGMPCHPSCFTFIQEL